jgi:Ca-activated chloride channel family protein
MEFDFGWMITISLGVIAAIVAPLYFVFRKRWNEQSYKHYYANTSRLTLTPQYKQVFRKYRLGLTAAVVMVGIALASMVGLSAKPVIIDETEPIKYSRDIVLCLDASGSMLYVDDAIIDKFSELVNHFNGERIGLVIFNSVANQVFPLTDDYTYIEEQFARIRNAIISGNPKDYDILTYTVRGDGASLVGDGLTACLQSFDTNNTFEQRSRSVILATDNLVNGTPILTLEEAINIAIRDEVKVYGINPGASDYYHANEVPRDVLNQVSDELEKEVKRTGGEYYDLADGITVPALVDRIEKEQTRAIVSNPVIVKTDIPDPFIWITFIAVVLFLLIAWRLKI